MECKDCNEYFSEKSDFDVDDIQREGSSLEFVRTFRSHFDNLSEFFIVVQPFEDRLFFCPCSYHLGVS